MNQQRAPSLRAPSLQQPLDAVVIRLKNLASPRVALFLRQIVIAGDQRQLADGRDRCRETGLTVAIDDEPRISLQHGRGIKRLGETLGDAGNADIPGDVPREFAVWEAERAEPLWDRAPGMIGSQHEIGAALGPQHANRRRIVRAQEPRRVLRHFGLNKPRRSARRSAPARDP